MSKSMNVNLFLRLGVSLFVTFIASCATLKQESASTSGKSSKVENGAIEKAIAQATAPASNIDEENPSVENIENYTIEEVIRIEEPNTQNLYDDSRYDFPITMNSRVEGWMDYFTGRGRPHMERYLSRSSRYIPMMKQVLKRMSLPEDLVYLALIESGFNLRAKSRARAVGPWQFIKGTGKRYGLRIDAWMDQRRDPVHATEAAARYLKDLYLMFESWYLAAAAYNAGEYKILRTIEKAKTNNFWALASTKLIRRETKDYVPKLIAAAIIAKNPTKYGFEGIDYEEPFDFEIVKVNFGLPLDQVAELINAPVDDLKDLNPELMRDRVPPDMDEYELRVPPGSKLLVERALGSMRSKLAGYKPPREHRVGRGETIASIARRYNLRPKELASINNINPKEKVKPGDKIIIPQRDQASVVKTAAVKNPSKPNEFGFVTHTVRSGESLWSISEKYDVTVQEIFKWNELRKSRIFPGTKLKIRVNAAVGDGREGQSRLNVRRQKTS